MIARLKQMRKDATRQSHGSRCKPCERTIQLRRYHDKKLVAS